jgi:hypothetical protein
MFFQIAWTAYVGGQSRRNQNPSFRLGGIPDTEQKNLTEHLFVHTTKLWKLSGITINKG